MPGSWQIRVYEGQNLVYLTTEGVGPMELGRQADGEKGPFHVSPTSGRRRMVIAPLNEDVISRQHALLEPLGEAKVRLTNLSKKLAIGLADGSDLKPKEARDMPLPAALTLGQKIVRIQAAAVGGDNLASLAEPTIPPGAGRTDPIQFRTLAAASEVGPVVETLLRWLHAAQGVLQSAASSADFFDKAARAVVDLIGLDSGRVLLLNGEHWRVESTQTAPGRPAEPEWQPSRQVLSRLRLEKKTFWIVPAQAAGEAVSLLGVEAVVAAPVLDVNGQVIGALYGDRRGGSSAVVPHIGRVEAMLVELLAGGVAAGLARVEQERAALAARIQFEQFFTPELSRHLTAQPGLLEGKECEVTVLFCDLRGFSRISERLGSATTLQWLRDVLGALSDCVLDRHGVLVDYTGDEVMAMWGAPREQPDHARLACDAALEMLARLPELDARWRHVLREPLGLGIGVNTGTACVGNTGSHRKFKYGPHGATVNLASRVQGATKYFKTNILVTGATQARLGGSLPLRRLCRVRVVNMVGPVELHQLAPPGQANWSGLKDSYETALKEFEAGRFRKVVGLLGALLNEHPDDGPSFVLLSRAVQAVNGGSAEGDPVWELPGK